MRSFLGSSSLVRLFAGRSLLKKIMITAVCLLVFSFETVNQWSVERGQRAIAYIQKRKRRKRKEHSLA